MSSVECHNILSGEQQTDFVVSHLIRGKIMGRLFSNSFETPIKYFKVNMNSVNEGLVWINLLTVLLFKAGYFSDKVVN